MTNRRPKCNIDPRSEAVLDQRIRLNGKLLCLSGDALSGVARLHEGDEFVPVPADCVARIEFHQVLRKVQSYPSSSGLIRIDETLSLKKFISI